MPPKPVARPKKDFSVSYPKIQAELATMQAKLTASQEEVLMATTARARNPDST